MDQKLEQQESEVLVAKLDVLVPSFLEVNAGWLTATSPRQMMAAAEKEEALKALGFVDIADEREHRLTGDLYALGALEFKTTIQDAPLVRVHNAFGIGTNMLPAWEGGHLDRYLSTVCPDGESMAVAIPACGGGHSLFQLRGSEIIRLTEDRIPQTSDRPYLILEAEV